FFELLHHVLRHLSELVPVGALDGELYREAALGGEARERQVLHGGAGHAGDLARFAAEPSHELLLAGPMRERRLDGALPGLFHRDEHDALVHEAALEAADG